MKLVLYLYKKFFTVFLGALFFFVLTLSLTDLFMNIWNYVSRSVPTDQIAIIMLYYIPKAVWYAIPISMLFATAYVLSDLYAKNELLAVFASGVSLFKFTVPLLVVALFMTVGLFLFEDNVVVQTYAKKTSLQAEVLHQSLSMNNDKIVIMADEGNVIYKADFYDDDVKRLYSLYVVYRTENKDFDAVVVADSAIWNGKYWDLQGGIEYYRGEGGICTRNVTEEHINRLIEEPETFRNNTLDVESVNTKEARAYIEHLEKAGLPCAEAKSEYYKKYSFPFVVFIVVFLAVGLSGKTRKNVLLISLALCIAAVVLFYVLQMVTMLMAKFESIPAVMGAWFPVIFFVLLSIVLLRFAKT